MNAATSWGRIVCVLAVKLIGAEKKKKGKYYFLPCRAWHPRPELAMTPMSFSLLLTRLWMMDSTAWSQRCAFELIEMQMLALVCCEDSKLKESNTGQNRVMSNQKMDSGGDGSG